MAKHRRSKPHKGNTNSDQNKTVADRQTIINQMSDTPHKNSPDLHEAKTSKKDAPPRPSEFLILVGDWLRSRKAAPREKSKAADWILAALTIAIAIAAFWSAFIFQGQLKEAQRFTEISERPWLSVELKPILLNWVNYPTGKQAVLKLRLSIRNVGKSIAKDIQINGEIFPTKVEMPVALDAAKNQRELCDHPIPDPVGRFDLFPVDEPAKREMDIPAIPTAIEAQAVSSTGDKPRKLVGFYVVGCASYRFSFGTQRHQTLFAYHLLGPRITTADGKPLTLPDGMPLIMGGFEIGVDVKEDQLGVIQELFGRNDAN